MDERKNQRRRVVQAVNGKWQGTDLAGTGACTRVKDGKASQSTFNRPTGVAVAAQGRVYVADSANNLVRVITP